MKAVDAIEQAVKNMNEERKERLRNRRLRTVSGMPVNSLWNFYDKEEYLKTAKEADLGANIMKL